MADDLIERAEAALAADDCGCGLEVCGWNDHELGAQARQLLPDLLAALKAARAENERLRSYKGAIKPRRYTDDDYQAWADHD